MNDVNTTIELIKRSLCNEIIVQHRGDGGFSIVTPVGFDDGDSYVVIIRPSNGGWTITDDGHTLMHISYSGTEFTHGTRRKIIDSIFAFHDIQHHDGVLMKSGVSTELLGYCVFSFLQAIARATNVTRMTKSTIRSTFLDDVRELLTEVVPSADLEHSWHDEEHDTDKLYVADYRINVAEPWLVFAITSREKCKDATIACLKYNQLGMKERRLALFEDQAKIPRHAVLQLTDVVDKQFTSFGDRNSISSYINNTILRRAS